MGRTTQACGSRIHSPGCEREPHAPDAQERSCDTSPSTRPFGDSSTGGAAEPALEQRVAPHTTLAERYREEGVIMDEHRTSTSSMALWAAGRPWSVPASMSGKS